MPKEIRSRLGQIEQKIRDREPLDKFDTFWMARRLRAYEQEMIRAATAIEDTIPGTGELDPTKIGSLVETYMKCLDQIMQIEQMRGTINRRVE